MHYLLCSLSRSGLLAHYAPVELGPKANPADTQYVPRPEWYYIPVFQWLKYWESGACRHRNSSDSGVCWSSVRGTAVSRSTPRAPAMEAPRGSNDLRVHLHWTGRLGRHQSSQ